MKYYALKHKPSGTLFGIFVSSNGNADFCNSCSVELEPHGNINPWIISNRERLEQLITNPVEWYNSDVDCPKLDKHYIDKVEIIEFDIPINLQ